MRALRFGLFSALLTTLVSCGSQPPPNILFVSLDTTRPDHLGLYGYSRPTSPNLDRLGSQGLVFDRAVAQMTITNPSHASMFTGLYPHTHEVGENTRRLADDFVTLTEILADRGYRSGGFVSGHPLRQEITGLTQGFDHYDSEMKRRRDGEVTVDRALAWLDTVQSAEEEAPYFLFVHFYDAHGPFRYREDLHHMFESQEPGPPVEFVPQYQRLRAPDGTKLRFQNQYIDRYDTALRYQDVHLGRLLERVDLDDTLVVVTADHGETLFERATQLHLNHGTSVFQEQIRIPLVFAGPGIEPGRTDRMAETVDLLPTLLGLFGWQPDVPYALQGEDLMAPETADRRATAFASNRARTTNHADRDYELRNREFIHTVQTEQWKLIRYPGKEEDYLELYDLMADPMELANLSTQEPRVLAGLQQILVGWARDIADEPNADLPQEELDALRALGYVN